MGLSGPIETPAIVQKFCVCPALWGEALGLPSDVQAGLSLPEGQTQLPQSRCSGAGVGAPGTFGGESPESSQRGLRLGLWSWRLKFFAA